MGCAATASAISGIETSQQTLLRANNGAFSYSTLESISILAKRLL